MAEVIIALDMPRREQALRLVDELGDRAGFFKVGFELFTREGPDLVEVLRDLGKKVFLDLKLHDIPKTVGAAVRAAGELGVDLLTVHATGGRAMLDAAREAKGQGGPRILAVTVLTSLDGAELGRVWDRSKVQVDDEVLRLARSAQDAGLDGIVSSPREVARLRAELGEGFLLVTPGIRPEGVASGDQVRTATPSEAVRAGANFLVVGRAVTGSAEPAHALEGILQEVDAARGVEVR